MQRPLCERPQPYIFSMPIERSRKRVGLSCGVLALVLQEADEVPYRDMPQPEHERVFGFVDQLVDPAGLEAGRDVDMRVRRHDGALGALIVETAATFDAGKLPVRGGHGDASVPRVAPAGQAGLGGVSRYGWMAAGRDRPLNGNIVTPG